MTQVTPRTHEPGAQELPGPLAEAARALADSGTASQVFDADGALRWLSEQMRLLIGARDGDDVGLGEAVNAVPDHPLWRQVLTGDALQVLDEIHAQQQDPVTPPPAISVRAVDVRLGDRHRRVGVLVLSLRAPDGERLGSALVYAPLLPARVLALVSEGDEAMFTRTADLTTPAQRPAAVVFADIDGSAVLSRHLPTPAYFDLVRGITTAFDEIVARHGGIVGKHAGDGASAYFLSEFHGSDSAAARAAIATVDELPAAVRTVVESLAAEGVALRPDDCRLNAGAHWGANLYIGQVVTGGRLEVTALGDEVNECARVEQVADDGQALVTKTLIERLAPHDAEAVGLVPRELTFRMLAELVTAEDPKALRDAGTLAVHDLVRPRQARS